MRRGIRRIAGLGEGKRLRKAVDLSLRHPSVEVVAVEKAKAGELLHFEYLRERKAKVKPSNLTIRAGIAAEEYLAREKANSFDHLYAHFLTQHLAHAKRAALFREVWRTLKPGTKFVVIEAWAYDKTLQMELRNAGFGVSAKRITAEELLKLGADNADNNTRSSIETRDTIELLRTMPKNAAANIISRITKGKASTIEGLKKINEQEVRELHTGLFNKYNRLKPSEEAKNSNKLVTRAIRGDSYFTTPFVVITATKPKVRHV